MEEGAPTHQAASSSGTFPRHADSLPLERRILDSWIALLHDRSSTFSENLISSSKERVHQIRKGDEHLKGFMLHPLPAISQSTQLLGLKEQVTTENAYWDPPFLINIYFCVFTYTNSSSMTIFV